MRPAFLPKWLPGPGGRWRVRGVVAGCLLLAWLVGWWVARLRQAAEIRRIDAGAAAVLGEKEVLIIQVTADGGLKWQGRQAPPNLQDALEVLRHRLGTRQLVVRVEVVEQSPRSRAAEVVRAVLAAGLPEPEVVVLEEM